MVIKEIDLDSLSKSEYLALLEALIDYYYCLYNEKISIQIGDKK